MAYSGNITGYCPIEKCRAKGGPTACWYHIPILLGNAGARINFAINDSEKAYYGKQYNKLKEQIKLHKRAKSQHRALKSSIHRLLREGTVQTHKTVPASIELGGNEASVVRECSLPLETQRALRRKGLASPTMYELDPKNGGAALFHDIMEKTREGNKHAAAVYVYPEDEYEDMKLFMDKDGTAGYALKWQEEEQTYDVVSVFSMKKKPYLNIDDVDESKYVRHKPAGQGIMLNAIANGGRILDCYDTTLPSLYSSVGFRQTGFDKWNDEYRPDDWNEEAFENWNDGKPGVTYMSFDPDDFDDYKSPDLNEDIYAGTLVTEDRRHIARKAAMRHKLVETPDEARAEEGSWRERIRPEMRTAGKGRTVVSAIDGRVTSNDVYNAAYAAVTAPAHYADMNAKLVFDYLEDGTRAYRVAIAYTDLSASKTAVDGGKIGERTFTDLAAAKKYKIALKRGMERLTYPEKQAQAQASGTDEHVHTAPGRFNEDSTKSIKTGPAWKAHEQKCAQSLASRYGNRVGVRQSKGDEISDIEVTTRSGKQVLVDAKSHSAHAGQFALRQDKDGRFQASTHADSEFVRDVVDYINANGTKMKSADTEIPVKGDAAAQFIKDRYAGAGTSFVVVTDGKGGEPFVCPTRDFDKCFDVRVVARKKKYGSNVVAKRDAHSVAETMRGLGYEFGADGNVTGGMRGVTRNGTPCGDGDRFSFEQDGRKYNVSTERGVTRVRSTSLADPNPTVLLHVDMKRGITDEMKREWQTEFEREINS